MQTISEKVSGLISTITDKSKTPKKKQEPKYKKRKDTEAVFNFQVDRELKDEFLRLARENNETAAGLLRKYVKNYTRRKKQC